MTELNKKQQTKPQLMKRFVWVLLPFLGLMLLFAKGLGNNPQELPSVQVGKPFPTFSLPDLEGKALSNADLPKDEVFLVNVFGSWCAACYQEHPFLMELSRELPIIGVNWGADNANEINDARAMLAQYGDPYRFAVHDGRGKLITDLGVYGAPETFLINRAGEIIHRHAGPIDKALWERELKPRLYR